MSKQCPVCARASAAVTWRKTYANHTHVLADTEHRRRLLGRIAACIARCHNPKTANYAAYGGRGVRVHPEWYTAGRSKDEATAGRSAFLAHLVTLPGWDDPLLDMDRIETDGNYEPGNLRFIPMGENRGSNKRTVRAMQQRIFELEARIRHLEQRAE